MHDHLSAPDAAALQGEVLAAIASALGPAAPGVGVAVDAGAVLLSGELHSMADRAAAVSAAQSVPGVVAVHDALAVRTGTAAFGVSDAEVTRAVRAAIDWASEEPDSVRAELWNGTVILTGQVRWEIEREALCHSVRLVPGVERVDDRLRVTQPERAASPSAPSEPRS